MMTNEQVMIDGKMRYFRGRVVLLSLTDDTRMATSSEYDFKCTPCYLNHPHSMAYHTDAVADVDAQHAAWEARCQTKASSN